MFKKCCKCKIEKSYEYFGKLKSSNDGYRYDCNDCRKEYRDKNKAHIKQKNQIYFKENKEALLQKNKIYRESNADAISIQRQKYRNQDAVKEHVKQKQKEYLPIRCQKIREKRKNDINFQMSEILRSKIHKMLHNKETSYIKYIGCDIDFLKSWLEFRFDSKMNWTNLGTCWQIDHILPINKFDMTNENDIRICFHWTNLQPLDSYENRQKSNKIQLHHYFNNIVNINRFNQVYRQYLGYQVLNESLKWLRIKLRYGNNATYNDNKLSEIGNPQPSL